MTETTVLAYFAARHEGELAKGFLERAGIAAALLADDAGGAEAGLTFVNPARLVSRKEDEQAARAILIDAGYEDRLIPGTTSAGSQGIDEERSSR